MRSLNITSELIEQADFNIKNTLLLWRNFSLPVTPLDHLF